MDFLNQKKFLYLPNTAGCYTSSEALRTLRLARDRRMEYSKAKF